MRVRCAEVSVGQAKLGSRHVRVCGHQAEVPRPYLTVLSSLPKALLADLSALHAELPSLLAELIGKHAELGFTCCRAKGQARLAC